MHHAIHHAMSTQCTVQYTVQCTMQCTVQCTMQCTMHLAMHHVQRRTACTNLLPPVAPPPLSSFSARVYLLWQLSQLSDAAANIAAALLADWFRMDL